MAVAELPPVVSKTEGCLGQRRRGLEAPEARRGCDVALRSFSLSLRLRRSLNLQPLHGWPTRSQPIDRLDTA